MKVMKWKPASGVLATSFFHLNGKKLTKASRKYKTVSFCPPVYEGVRYNVKFVLSRSTWSRLLSWQKQRIVPRSLSMCEFGFVGIRFQNHEQTMTGNRSLVSWAIFVDTIRFSIWAKSFSSATNALIFNWRASVDKNAFLANEASNLTKRALLGVFALQRHSLSAFKIIFHLTRLRLLLRLG